MKPCTKSTSRSAPGEVPAKPDPAGSIDTPYGPAVQDMGKESMELFDYVKGGGTVYRQGEFGKQFTSDAQFWSGKNPLTTVNYAEDFGLPPSQIDWVMGGTIEAGTNFVTRPAPGAGGRGGGAIEIVTEPNAVGDL